MRTTRVSGIHLDYFRLRHLPRLDGFGHPEVPKSQEPVQPRVGRQYESGGGFEILKNAIAEAIREGDEAKNRRTEGYATATNKSGEIVGFAYSDGSFVVHETIEGRRVTIPDISGVHVHPDYRNLEKEQERPNLFFNSDTILIHACVN